MLCIRSLNHDPFYNLAAEEYLLRNTREEVFMLWQSDPVVVVGKHQNTLAEINYRYVRMNHIPVARRLTGGGTVYHDAGNINFTFIRRGEPGKLVDFGSFIRPVITFLEKIGLEANRGPKNEVLVNGRKISGNAEHVYRDRVLHHGTLLFNADLSKLKESIRPGPGKYLDKAVQSNRSSVINLADCMQVPMGIQEFCDRFMHDIKASHHGTLYNPGKEETAAFEKIAGEKYRSWEWIYGWSPDYRYLRDFRAGEICLSTEIKVHKGIIASCILSSPSIPEEMCLNLMSKLPGTPHEESNIRKLLAECGLNKVIKKEHYEDFVFSFFG